MELKILNIEYVEMLVGFPNALKSITWKYGDISGTLPLAEPSQENFVPFEEINVDILKNWVTQKINLEDFLIQEDPVEKQEIILVKEFD